MDIAQLSMNMADAKLAQGFSVGMVKMAIEQTETVGVLMSETVESVGAALPPIPDAAAATIDLQI